MKTRVRRFARYAFLALVFAAMTSTVSLPEKGGGLFTITDDSDPVMGVVHVLVGNSSSSTRSGHVEVRAWFQGVPARRAEPVTVQGDGTATVDVYFGSGLGDVIQSAIIEDPDPIPL
jgi:hypothetical protein